MGIHRFWQVFGELLVGLRAIPGWFSGKKRWGPLGLLSRPLSFKQLLPTRHLKIISNFCYLKS